MCVGSVVQVDCTVSSLFAAIVMDTRSQLVYSEIIGKFSFCLIVLLSMRLCSVECSDVLLPCDDSASASGSGEDGSADNTITSPGIELCPVTSTSETPSIITQTLSNTITSEIQQSSSVLLSSSTSELMTAPSSIQSTSSSQLATPAVSSTSATSLSLSSSTIRVSQSIETTLTVSPISTPEPTRTTTESPMTSSPGPMTTTTTDATTNVTTTQSVFEIIRRFFEELSLNSLIGFGVGGVVVLILLLIICIFCCCCIHSRLKKRKRGRMDLTNHRQSLTISNPIAMVSSSSNHNEKTPARYRSTLHDPLDDYSDDVVNIKDLDSDLFNFPSTEYRESAVDDGERAYIIMSQPSQLTHATQPSQMTQMSTATDLFRERSLPRLSPLSYSSQMLTAPQFPTHCPSLSVDENDTLGSRRQSLMALIPNPSPSLRVPTLMARSLKNEESKSAQGSKISVQGSRTSMQGSRPSMLGSRGSVHTGTGSRSQIYSSNPSSREHSVLLLNGAREFGVSEDDAVSLPLSGRGISPAMKQNSFEEVPTRDSPGPEIASHAVGYGKKDFASLTCIPNQYAVEAERLEEKQQLSTVPEKQSIDEEKDKGANTETKKKPRSRAMSKLEKLTSLDYIRASLRLKKKKVSFEKTPESTKKEKQKNVKEKPNPETKVKGQVQATHDNVGHPGKDVLQSRRHSASGRAEFSPQHHAQQIPTNKYPDHYYYPQLSQPLYYGGAGVHPAAVFYQYPQLSQQYYAQLSQGGYGGGQGGYGAGPYPPHPHMLYQGNMMDPYSRSYGEPTTGSRYQTIVTPDLEYNDTPEPDFYQERSPDNVLQQGQQENGFSDAFRSPEHSNMRPSSPDRFTETSDTSSYAMHPPSSASHSHEDSITSAHKHFMDEFVMDSTEHYGYGGEQHHVPTYPGDMLNRTGHIPHEAYRDAYQHGDMGMGHDYDTHIQANGHHYSSYTSPTAYSAVTQSKGARRPSRSSYASSTSDHAPLEALQEGEGPGTKNGDLNGSSTKNRVSWSTEVIEYQRTPSDLADSDFDFNQF